MKYKVKDVIHIMDILQKVEDTLTEEQALQLNQYPAYVIEEILHCIDFMSKYDEAYVKENYLYILGYITFRINIKEIKQQKKDEQAEKTQDSH